MSEKHLKRCDSCGREAVAGVHTGQWYVLTTPNVIGSHLGRTLDLCSIGCLRAIILGKEMPDESVCGKLADDDIVARVGCRMHYNPQRGLCVCTRCGDRLEAINDYRKEILRLLGETPSTYSAWEKVKALLLDNERLVGLAHLCNDPHHDSRWCSTCENRLAGIDDLAQALLQILKEEMPNGTDNGTG